jgi:CYTH domain-containing protein
MRMGEEIERKFLIKSNSWRSLAKGKRVRQGYLNRNEERVVRIRAIDEKGFLTIKGKTTGATRAEFEYDIPAPEAEAMLEHLCEKPLIEKNRYKIEFSGLIWEVDEFLGENQGLIVAEVELESEDQPFEKPTWIGGEVTGDPKYFNSNLVQHPYTKW